MSEERPSVHRLPLEVMGLILLKLGNPSERKFDEIKKCRFISPRWYKAVQDIFQEYFSQKYLTHFDGSKYTYGQSRRFGLNVFGSFPLNFATFKISNSELYLMKDNILARLSSTNLQNLILQDNQLNLKDLLEVLKMFPNIVKLEFIQSSKDIIVAEKICQLYSNPDDKSDSETIEMIKKELAGTENFLQNLKKIDLKIVHASVLNFIILIIFCSECELEELSIVFNSLGIVKIMNRLKSIQANEANYKNFSIGPITQLNKFSKSLKKIKITANPPLVSPMNYTYITGKCRSGVRPEISRFVQSIYNIFNGNQLSDLNNIKELQINFHISQNTQNESTAGLLNFIKSQNNLSKVEVGIATEPQYYGPDEENREVRFQLRKTFLESLCSVGAIFGYEVTHFGLDPIVQFSENLAILEINISPGSNWNFSDLQTTFPNCYSLILRNACRYDATNDRYPTFGVPLIVQKFPNLKKLLIGDMDSQGRSRDRPQISNQEFQIIIRNFPNLEQLNLNGCIAYLDDSGLTGLTPEALELRKNSPYLPITPEERPGLPISHLKNLARLLLFKDPEYDDGIDIQPADGPQITDLTTIYGFENEAPKFNCLYIANCNITETGIEVLRRKLPSNCQLFSKHYAYYFDYY